MQIKLPHKKPTYSNIHLWRTIWHKRQLKSIPEKLISLLFISSEYNYKRAYTKQECHKCIVINQVSKFWVQVTLSVPENLGAMKKTINLFQHRDIMTK